MEKEKNKKIEKLVFIIVIGLGIFVAAFLAYALYIRFSTPKEYMIHTENHFDYQLHYECSGYASAYVLRSLGVDVDGLELYKEIPDKNEDGTVAADMLVEYLKDKNYSAKLRCGTVWQLKHQVSKGVPVIAFVRSYPDAQYLHYLPIVGYDEKNLYAADSLYNLKNASDEYYNRKIPIKDFENMWSTKVAVDNVFIVVGKK